MIQGALALAAPLPAPCLPGVSSSVGRVVVCEEGELWEQMGELAWECRGVPSGGAPGGRLLYSVWCPWWGQSPPGPCAGPAGSLLGTVWVTFRVEVQMWKEWADGFNLEWGLGR